MDYESTDFNEWQHFDDRTSDDRTVGPARATETKGRCANCWSKAAGRKNRDGHWIRIECQLCGRSVEGKDAEREAERMQIEAVDNMPSARVGRGSKYDEDARFVLKILPDMDRDQTQFEQRVAARRKAEPKKHCLGRRDCPPGTAGYLYAQACAYLSGLDNLPREMSAIPLSDVDFGKPRIVGIEGSTANTPLRVSAEMPASLRKPSDSALMARMGTAMVAGMTAAFACEIGMKAILMTRLDEAEKTHDLLKLYHALPADSRERLDADFAGITDALGDNRHTFDRWRYFEGSAGKDAMAALVNTDRVWELGRAARVTLDECVVAGLTYEIRLKTEFDVTTDSGDASMSQRIDLSVVGGEAAIPWDDVLAAGRSASA